MLSAISSSLLQASASLYSSIVKRNGLAKFKINDRFEKTVHSQSWISIHPNHPSAPLEQRRPRISFQRTSNTKGKYNRVYQLWGNGSAPSEVGSEVNPFFETIRLLTIFTFIIIVPSMEVLADGIVVTQQNVPYLLVEGITALVLLILLLVYFCKFHPSAPIVGILGLLLFNDMLQILFELPAFIDQPPELVCLVSITGSTFFRLASYYWLIFITKLIYQEKAIPGKHLNLVKKVGKNLVFTYFPSIMVSILILIVSKLDGTTNLTSCWKIISEKQLTDYIIYMASFVFPPLVAVVMIIGYLVAYLRLRPQEHSIFLVYPIVAIPFMIYYLVIKLCSFLGIDILNGNGDIPLIVEPLAHCVIFLLTLRNVNGGLNQNMSDLTLNDDNNRDSLVVMQP